MKQYSIFNIIGPDMIGPSSSHTAGAAKLSFMAQKIFGMPVKQVLLNFMVPLEIHTKDMVQIRRY